jgi:colicin import membrane protein
MQGNQISAFFMSTLLHGIVAGLLLFLAYTMGDDEKETPKIFELVAGEGDNYMATEAPALGVPGGIKVDIPEPPQPVTKHVEPSPVQAAPKPVIERVSEPATKKAESIPDLNKLLKQKTAITQIRKEANDRRAKQIAERKAKAAADSKAREEALEKRKMTKADFDRQNKSKSNAPKPKGSAPKIAKIDTEGIVNGMIGGNKANTTGGAGGTALTRSEGDAIDGYAALLGTKIKAELDERPGVGAGLIVEVEIRILADGTLKGFRIVRSSGSSDFDGAVRDAFANIRMPPRPKGLPELQRFPIRGVD